MIPHKFVLDYANYELELQIAMQIKLARHYAQDFYDISDLTDELLKKLIVASLQHDLKDYEKNEQYEYCILYKDTIDNIKHISIKHLL